jgi:aryl-alcohol dehydrogenase-like predicted oxidoreductase
MNETVERVYLRSDYSVSNIIKGGWHLAGGHGYISEEQAIEDMYAFAKAGVTTFDCADIYTGVEELIGRFLKKYESAFLSGDLPYVQIHTKYVPDYDALATLTKADTEKIIDRSLQRLGVERLDLVQFAWWDYSFPKYVEAAIHLSELQKAGKIRYIGATNFDGTHLQEIIDAGVDIIAHQVQYSVLDQRPEADQLALAKASNYSFFCYGSVAGGFLSDKYLNSPEPKEPLENRSLTKYKLIIDEYGGYESFQYLLSILKAISEKYHVGIGEVAIKYILQKDQVAAAIVGARNTEHLSRLLVINSFNLALEDLTLIDNALASRKGPFGPVYELERDKSGKHGAIMRYNLNHQR